MALVVTVRYYLGENVSVTDEVISDTIAAYPEQSARWIAGYLVALWRPPGA